MNKVNVLDNLVKMKVLKSYVLKTLDEDGNPTDSTNGMRQTQVVSITFLSGEVLDIGTFCSGIAENTALLFEIKPSNTVHVHPIDGHCLRCRCPKDIVEKYGDYHGCGPCGLRIPNPIVTSPFPGVNFCGKSAWHIHTTDDKKHKDFHNAINSDWE